MEFGILPFQGSLTMNVELEKHRVLQIIQRERDVEELEEYKIPYHRTLEYLRQLLVSGLIKRADNGQLVLTESGAKVVAMAPESTAGATTEDDILSGARRTAINQELVFLPEDDV